MNNYFTSLIRTWVPLAVGAIISWLALHGASPHLTDSQMTNLTAALTGVIVAVYYALVRLFEHYVSPKFGWLLGVAKMPTYTATPPAPSPAVSPPVAQGEKSLDGTTPAPPAPTN